MDKFKLFTFLFTIGLIAALTWLFMEMDIVNRATYYKDSDTGLCYRYTMLAGETVVPCENIEGKVKINVR